MPRNGTQSSADCVRKSELCFGSRCDGIPLIVDDLPCRDHSRVTDCGQSRTTITLKSALDAPTSPDAVLISGVQTKIICESHFQAQCSPDRGDARDEDLRDRA